MFPRGLYAVTPDEADTRALVEKVTAALIGGARVVQYRNKLASPELKLYQAGELKRVCDENGALLIVNDDAEIARNVVAAGVHIGADDGDVRAARAIVGDKAIVGVSCYRNVELAIEARSAGADYVAFGSFFPSSVKPNAVRAPIQLLREAKRAIDAPVVAIGGITIDNAAALVEAGADGLAVITAVFSAPDITAAARAFAAMYSNERMR